MILLLLACTEPVKPAVAAPNDGALGEGALNPFPNAELVEDGVVAIPVGLLPRAEEGTDWDVTRLNGRAGFSPVQPAVALLPVPVDPDSLSGQDGVGVGGSVRLVDLDAGEELPCFAELDAYPDARDDGRASLIVRPMRAMTVGHRVAVVVTDAVTSGGAPLSLDAWADAKAAGGHYADLDAELAAQGFSGVALAWDFPVGDGTAITRALAARVEVPAAYTWSRTVDADDGGDETLPPGVWKKLEGAYTTGNWLVDDTVFALGADGLPEDQGTTESYLYVHVPDAARTAAAGTVPVVIFGHGILSEPGDYLDEDDDPSAVIALSNQLGAIVVATKWRGLTKTDQAEAITVARDFGRFAELTDKLAQGVANTLALIRLVDEGALLDDPLLAAADGAPLADRSRLYWYGISLGSIEGAVTLANQSRIEHAVLHVGGSAWATMLERSSNWPTFEYLVSDTVEDPWERQVLYATSQLLWDGVDPASYAEDLAGRSILWQEAIGDDQVPNLTTELLARSIGVPLGTPAVTSPYGVDTVALTTTAPVMVQFDPEKTPPEAANRPAEVTHAHHEPRLWAGTQAQVVGFFTAGQEGTVAHHCGSEPCSASNQGE